MASTVDEAYNKISSSHNDVQLRQTTTWKCSDTNSGQAVTVCGCVKQPIKQCEVATHAPTCMTESPCESGSLFASFHVAVLCLVVSQDSHIGLEWRFSSH